MEDNFEAIQRTEVKIKKAEEKVKNLKKRKALLEAQGNALKKRKTACGKAELIEHKRQARYDGARMTDLLDDIRNVHVPGECDQLKTRGAKCHAKAVKFHHGSWFCTKCLIDSRDS
jgi:hypothetical protein